MCRCLLSLGDFCLDHCRLSTFTRKQRSTAPSRLGAFRARGYILRVCLAIAGPSGINLCCQTLRTTGVIMTSFFLLFTSRLSSTLALHCGAYCKMADNPNDYFDKNQASMPKFAHTRTFVEHRKQSPHMLKIKIASKGQSVKKLGDPTSM